MGHDGKELGGRLLGASLEQATQQDATKNDQQEVAHPAPECRHRYIWRFLLGRMVEFYVAHVESVAVAPYPPDKLGGLLSPLDHELVGWTSGALTAALLNQVMQVFQPLWIHSRPRNKEIFIVYCARHLRHVKGATMPPGMTSRAGSQW